MSSQLELTAEQRGKFLSDPLLFKALCWPEIQFYDKQVEIIESVRDNDETIVPAGNMLGKDFIAAFIALWYFLSNDEVRIVTTSVKDDHLRVLWDELGRYIRTSRYPMLHKDGGPLIHNHHDIRKVVAGKLKDISYLTGMVSKKGEGMAGHHAEYTLGIIDEASGVDEYVYTQMDTWAKKKLIFGNPNPTTNFFYTGVKAGDLYSKDGARCYRKVIRVKATDSPNVALGIRQRALGLTPSYETLLPGVLSYDAYEKRRATWDPVRQSIGLDAEFWEGAESLLYPPDWLNRAERIYKELLATPQALRKGESMGVDTGEGGDDTAWCVINRRSILRMRAERTPDTSVVANITLGLMREFGLAPKQVVFDRGGGGKQHADYLRRQGYDVRTVGFGEAATNTLRKNKGLSRAEQAALEEPRLAFKNRRAEMYGLARFELFDPSMNPLGFGLPDTMHELRRQLSIMPLLYNEEGVIYLPPKDKPTPSYKGDTIRAMLGRSPDHADAFVLAVFGMLVKDKKKMLRAA